VEWKEENLAWWRRKMDASWRLQLTESGGLMVRCCQFPRSKVGILRLVDEDVAASTWRRRILSSGG
jgi:hypothetical protein